MQPHDLKWRVYKWSAYTQAGLQSKKEEEENLAVPAMVLSPPLSPAMTTIVFSAIPASSSAHTVRPMASSSMMLRAQYTRS